MFAVADETPAVRACLRHSVLVVAVAWREMALVCQSTKSAMTWVGPSLLQMLIVPALVMTRLGSLGRRRR